MKHEFLFFKATLYKSLTLMRRYYVDTASRVVTVYAFFLLLFVTGRAVAPEAIDGSLEGLVVGYFLWTIAVGAYSSVSADLTTEAQWGTLEQLFTTPLGTGRVVLVKAIANLVTSFLFGFVVLALVLVSTGTRLNLRPATVLPIAVLAIVPVIGIGLLFGGLAVLYKRIGNAFGLVRFGLIGLVAAPVDRFPALRYVPLAHGTDMLKRAMSDGTGIREFPASELVLLVGVAVGYLAAGYWGFLVLHRIAKRRGVLGHY